MENKVSRRAFTGTVIAAASALGANDRVSIGLIGTGDRSTALIKELRQCANVAVPAICDVWSVNREKMAARVKEIWGSTPRATSDYRELLSWKDVDAVVIAPPDAFHSIMLKAAVEAGKDAYCEKPMGTAFAEAKAAYLAVKNSRQVVQIGTQRRSFPCHIDAARHMRAGALGKLTRVDVAVNVQAPRWRRDYAEVRASDIDWKPFYMGRPAPPDPVRVLRQWQLFRYTTNGIPGLWLSHFADLPPWFTGDLYPSSVVAQAGVYLWKDGRETEDLFHSIFEYPSGFQFSFEMGLTNAAPAMRNMWHGTRGTLDLEKKVISPEGSEMPDRLTAPIALDLTPTKSHMQDFIDCVRSRKTPRADIQAGFSHAVAGCMSAIARDSGRKVRFDAARLEIV